MRIFITGGTGFVGRQLCRNLIEAGHDIKALVRAGSEPRLIRDPAIKAVREDLFSDQLAQQISGCDAVIHLIGIIREFPNRGISFQHLHLEATEAIIAATQAAGVGRYLHMSANGTRADAVSSYHQTKWLAEERVRASSLEWTIFRPSLIYGQEDQFINMLISLIRRLPAVPVIGDGEYRMQPVPVEQVAAGFAAALSRPASIGKTYHCGGADCLSYNQLLDAIGSALGRKRVCKIKQPLALMRPAVALLQNLSLFPMTSDQLQMLVEGNCCDTSAWTADLGIEPQPLSGGLGYLHK